MRVRAVRPRAPAVKQLVVGRENIARSLHVSTHTIDSWVAKGMPVLEKRQYGKSTYDLDAVREWIQQRGTRDSSVQAPGTRADADLAHVLQKIRVARAHADKAELELRARREELLDREEVERGRVQRVEAVKAALLSMPAKLAPEILGRDQRATQAALERWARHVCEEFAR